MFKAYPIFNKHNKQQGFSLIELMLGMVLLGITVFSTSTILVDSSKIMLSTVQRTEMTQKNRLFVQRIRTEAQSANHAYLYSSLDLADRDNKGDRIEEAAGDCLVLINTTNSMQINTPNYHKSIIIYYRNADAQGNSAIFRREAKFGPTDHQVMDDSLFETFLTNRINNGDFSNAEVMVSDTQGLLNNKIFESHENQSFIVYGKFRYNNASTESIKTINLTLSTGG